MTFKIENREDYHSLPGYTYIIVSRTGKVYTGATIDLKRIQEHNKGIRKAWTNGGRWHYGEVRKFETFYEALKFEYSLKKNGRTKKRIILGSSRIKKLMERHKFELINYRIK